MSYAAISLHGITTQWMSDGLLAWEGLAWEVALAALYVWAASRRSARGNRWPRYRTAAFLVGLATIAVALQSGLAAYDDVFWVHNLQHVLLMMVAPPLLALGAPITLALRSTRGHARRRLLGVLHDRSVRSATSRPLVLVLDYNATMAIYLLTPLYRLSLEHLGLHIAIHFYFLLCGLLFWIPIVGVDPVPGRLAPRRRIGLAALAIPINVGVAVALLLHPSTVTGSPQAAIDSGALSLLVAGTAAALAGVLLVALCARAPAAGPRVGARRRSPLGGRVPLPAGAAGHTAPPKSSDCLHRS